MQWCVSLTSILPTGLRTFSHFCPLFVSIYDLSARKGGCTAHPGGIHIPPGSAVPRLTPTASRGIPSFSAIFLRPKTYPQVQPISCVHWAHSTHMMLFEIEPAHAGLQTMRAILNTQSLDLWLMMKLAIRSRAVPVSRSRSPKEVLLPMLKA